MEKKYTGLFDFDHFMNEIIELFSKENKVFKLIFSIFSNPLYVLHSMVFHKYNNTGRNYRKFLLTESCYKKLRKMKIQIQINLIIILFLKNMKVY